VAFSKLSSLNGRNHGQDYDPDQPRMPAGEPNGGQWTSRGGQPGDVGWPTAPRDGFSPLGDLSTGFRIAPERSDFVRVAGAGSVAKELGTDQPAHLQQIASESRRVIPNEAFFVLQSIQDNVPGNFFDGSKQITGILDRRGTMIERDWNNTTVTVKNGAVVSLGADGRGATLMGVTGDDDRITIDLETGVATIER
jgi:hypothetical protein